MTEKLITVSKAAENVGISPKVLRCAITCEELPAYNMGRGNCRPRWFVKMSDVLRYIESRKNESETSFFPVK